MIDIGAVPKHMIQRYQTVVNSTDYFSGANEIQIVEIHPDKAIGILRVQPNSRNPFGMIHGGCLTTLADTTVGTALGANGFISVTINSTMHYLRSPKGNIVTCVATPGTARDKVCVCETILTDEDGTTVATGTFTFFIKKQLALPEMEFFLQELEQHTADLHGEKTIE